MAGLRPRLERLLGRQNGQPPVPFYDLTAEQLAGLLGGTPAEARGHLKGRSPRPRQAIIRFAIPPGRAGDDVP